MAAADEKPAAPAKVVAKGRYEVSAALAICYTEEGGQTYVYRGGLVPVGTPEWHVKHLLESNLIKPVE